MHERRNRHTALQREAMTNRHTDRNADQAVPPAEAAIDTGSKKDVERILRIGAPELLSHAEAQHRTRTRAEAARIVGAREPEIEHQLGRGAHPLAPLPNQYRPRVPIPRN